VTVRARDEAGKAREFEALVRLDTPQELVYYINGGILQYVIRQLLSGRSPTQAAHGGMAGAPQARPGTRPDNGLVEKGSEDSFPASDPPTDGPRHCRRPPCSTRLHVAPPRALPWHSGGIAASAPAKPTTDPAQGRHLHLSWRRPWPMSAVACLGLPA